MIMPIIVFFAFISVSTFGQDLPAPDYYNQPYYLNDSNKLEKIERVDATYEVKIKGMGYGGFEMYFSAFNEKSAIRFPSNKPLVFLIKLNTDEDPEGFISVAIGTVKKKKRRFIFDSRSMMGKAKDVSDRHINTIVEKLKDDIFKITIQDKLSPGEYAFKPFTSIDLQGNVAGGMNQTIYCFGID